MENPRTFTPSSMQVIEVWADTVADALHEIARELWGRENDSPLVIGLNVEHHGSEGYDNVLVSAFLDDCKIPEPEEKVPYA